MVYEPREDSELLRDCVERFAFGRVLDMGTGSGFQGIAAAKKDGVEEVVCADIDAQALASAKENAEKDGVASKITFVKSDLFSAIDGFFDCIAFNPPYLPEDDETVGDVALESGESGREATDWFLAEFAEHLAEGGVLLLLQSTASDKGETEKYLVEHGFTTEKVASRRFFFEEIFVLKAMKCR
ncbi:putative S-adenosylmethionine-dependent methyltransferase [Candidatus Norongarragalina meridionalis]|nr:putative S-adenosylmethionine-dependent methyltransferase [Candidatus Norongarragalina meridionalis]